MTKDKEFLNTLQDSFKTYLETDARSNEKLKILHKKISEDFLSVLGDEYIVNSLGLDDDFGKEAEVIGRYYDKKVDITISKNNEHIAGIGVKFVMSNYSQNSNNYFENMMGETVNLRLTQFKYYQVFVIFDRLPYFKNGGIIQKIEQITEHNISKYIKLGGENIDCYFHVPNKTLLYIIHINPLPNDKMIGYNKEKYKAFYNNSFTIGLSQMTITQSKNIIYNKYEEFVNKCCHEIMSI